MLGPPRGQIEKLVLRKILGSDLGFRRVLGSNPGGRIKNQKKVGRERALTLGFGPAYARTP